MSSIKANPLIPVPLQRLGSIFFSSAIAALGVLHLLMDYFQGTRPVSEISWFSILTFLEFFFWTVLVVFSIGILLSDKAHVPAKWMGWCMFIWILVRHVPLLVTDPGNPAEWNFACMALAICGGAFIVASPSPGSKNADQQVKTTGKILLGLSIMVLGFQHLYYADFLSSMIPQWIPMKITWMWITGVTLIIAGVAFLFDIKISSASLAISMMIFSWIIILHLPRLISQSNDFYEWIYSFQALAVASGALTQYGVDKMQKRLTRPTTMESFSSLNAEGTASELQKPFEHPQKNYKSKGRKTKAYRTTSIKR